MQQFFVNKNDSGQRLDKYLSKCFPALPKSLSYKFIRTKSIKVNGKRALPDQILAENDVITTFIPFEFTAKDGSEFAFKSMRPHIDVIYEDGDLLICNKPAGMSAVPDEREKDNVLINHVKSYLYQKKEYDPDLENSFAPALCNRIDRNTGGIVIAAKNSETLRRVNELIRTRNVTKKYLCVVHGVPYKNEDVIKAYAVKDKDKNLVTVFKDDPHLPGCKTMITGYKVLASRNGLSLLEVELFTGRTHQIRAHLAFIGYPLLGDGKYGINREDRKMGYKYQALYSYYLKLDGREFVIPKDKIWFIEELFPELK